MNNNYGIYLCRFYYYYGTIVQVLCLLAELWLACDPFGKVGFGHTSSQTDSGQNCLIESYRYHCLSSESPRGWIMGGSWDWVGFQEKSLRRRV